MIEVRPFRYGKHQSDSASIEECHLRWHSKEMLHAERFFIKCSGAHQIVHVHGDLANLR